MKNQLLIAFRNILKNKINSVITITGMSVGLACILLIYLFVSQEYSYNNFFEDRDHIYRLNYKAKYTSGSQPGEVLLNYTLPAELMEKVSQTENSTSYREAGDIIFNYQHQNYTQRLSMADSNFFKIFSFNLIAGNRELLFHNPDEIVITRNVADKYLKLKNSTYQDLLGQIIELDNDIPFTITGILEDIPHNSTINFDGIIPNYNYINRFSRSQNDFGNTLVFMKLKPGTDVAQTENNIAEVVTDHYRNTLIDLQQENVMLKSDDCFTPFLISLKEGYLNDSVENPYEKQSSKKYSLILIAIGMIVLFIACCNYIILTLGQSLKKVGEVGIRKSLGARTSNIFNLFFAEGMLLTFISLLLALLLIKVLIPVFGRLAHTEIFPELINYPKTLLFIVTGLLVIVLLTSLIPGLVFANIRPNLMSSKKIQMGNKSLYSKFFVAFQYSISIILIIVTMFMMRQTKYMKNQSLGFSKDHILDINVDFLEDDDRYALNTLIQQHAGVVNSTLTDRNYINGDWTSSIRKNDYESIDVRVLKVDNNYIPTLGINLLEGENFTELNIQPNDRTIIVNQKLVSLFEMKEPVGKFLDFNGREFKIIGVVEDFHYDSMKERIEPLILCARTHYGNESSVILVKFIPEQLAHVIEHIKKSWKETTPDLDLNFSFWDVELKGWYETEERWSKIIASASIIAIIISLLGLFGLTVMLTNQRIKEIGIRKVNGAKIIEVVNTLNLAFLTWLVVALIIACPLAHVIVNYWLESYPYKVPVSWWVFLMSGALAICIAFITISWQSWRVASRNPVEALRYE